MREQSAEFLSDAMRLAYGHLNALATSLSLPRDDALIAIGRAQGEGAKGREEVLRELFRTVEKLIQDAKVAAAYVEQRGGAALHLDTAIRWADSIIQHLETAIKFEQDESIREVYVEHKYLLERAVNVFRQEKDRLYPGFKPAYEA